MKYYFHVWMKYATYVEGISWRATQITNSSHKPFYATNRIFIYIVYTVCVCVYSNILLSYFQKSSLRNEIQYEFYSSYVWFPSRTEFFWYLFYKLDFMQNRITKKKLVISKSVSTGFHTTWSIHLFCVGFNFYCIAKN